MKKRLEAELISIAHRILKLKNKSEVDQLYKETQKLYETLSVLKFYQDNFEQVKGDVAEDILEEKVTQSLEKETPQQVVVEIKEEVVEPVAEVVTEVEPEIEEEPIVSEEEAEKEPEIVEDKPVFKPIFELEVELEDDSEPAETASEVKPETKQVSLNELLGENYVEPVFVKPNEVSLFSSATEEKENPTETLSDTLSKGFTIGLNDRIGFVKNLFADSDEDFNRVISQLNTFDTFEEAKNFINEMVIPDYNYWVGKEDYIERFMEMVEKKFQ